MPTPQLPVCVLFLSQRASASDLQRQIGAEYHITAQHHVPDASALQHIRVCIIDGPQLLAHQAWLRARRAAEGPMVLPVLLLTTQHNTFLRDQNFADIIDETVLVPIDPRLLQARLRALLQMQDLYRDNARMLADKVKHVEELIEERHIRSRFVAALAHDLRTPLTSTQLAADLLLRDTQLSDKHRRYALRITQSIARLDRMLYDVIDANQLQSGQPMPLKPTAQDLAQMATQALGDWHAQYPERFAPQSFASLEGIWDAHTIRRALDNLVTNALKYSDAGSAIIIKLDAGPGEATLRVINAGPVIPEAEQRHLFELFHRAPAAIDGNQQGWGIGLALVRAIALAHQGDVAVESSKQRGTEFRLRIKSLGADASVEA